MDDINQLKFKMAIIDGDPLVYRCGFAIEETDKETGIVHVEPFSHATYNMDNMIANIINNTGCSQERLFITASKDSTNFRYTIDPNYKKNRINARRPVYYEELRQYLVDEWKAITVYGEEADDACSIAHCENNRFEEDDHGSIVCSIDKDFNNIPGWHYNYMTKKIYFIDKLAALRHFYLQILTGDTSDGIPRIKKGWREKPTKKLLEKAETEIDMCNIVFNEMWSVLKIGFGESQPYFPLSKETSFALINKARLVWLRREEDQMWELPDEQRN